MVPGSYYQTSALNFERNVTILENCATLYFSFINIRVKRMERDTGKCSDGGSGTVGGRCGDQSEGAISASSF
jgi:hypothetical protein